MGKPPKTARRSRSLRIHFSSGNPALIFKPSVEEWEKLEQALGRSLAEHAKEQIMSEVGRYYVRQHFEQAAPFLSDVLDRLKKIETAAACLRDALNDSDPGERDDQLHVRATLAQLINFAGSEPGVELLELFETFNNSMVSAAANAAEDFKQDAGTAGFVEGDAWSLLMLNLRTSMKNMGLPTGAAQSSDKATSDAGSPFVQFIVELQKLFPSDSMRRHERASPQALAKEINRATNAARRNFGTLTLNLSDG